VVAAAATWGRATFAEWAECRLLADSVPDAVVDFFSSVFSVFEEAVFVSDPEEAVFADPAAGWATRVSAPASATDNLAAALVSSLPCSVSSLRRKDAPVPSSEAIAEAFAAIGLCVDPADVLA
jgi:hypothetical protein